LYGYDSSLSFIAVYYALCGQQLWGELLHATVAAAAATLMHTAVSVTMAKVALPSGTLGFVFATMVGVCCVKGAEKDEHQRAPADDAVLAGGTQKGIQASSCRCSIVMKLHRRRLLLAQRQAALDLSLSQVFTLGHHVIH